MASKCFTNNIEHDEYLIILLPVLNVVISYLYQPKMMKLNVLVVRNQT